MLVGTADPALLARGAPEVPDFKTEPLVLSDVDMLKIICEVPAADLERRLPPGLHPTLPPLLTWLAYAVPESPWGAFAMVQTLLECRSGTRPRAYLVQGAIDNPDAGAALSSRWGYRLAPATVEFKRSYDQTELRVAFDGSEVLAVGLRDPDPLAPGDLQHIANVNLAHTPRGLRLLQVDPAYDISRAERGAPVVETFDAAAWGDATLEPVFPIVASLALSSVTLPALRYVCRPDTLAFQGTEKT